jgi:FKBP-type peptidyl-prolyl cis-trans isomerase FklB
MKKLFIVALALVAGASLSTIQAGKKNKKAPKSTLQLVSGSDSLSYTAGYVLADIVRDRFLAGLGKEVNDSEDSLQLSLAYQGLFDALRGDTTLFKTPQAERFLNNRVSDIRKAKEEKLKKVGIDFLKENAQKEGVVTLPSGLQYKVLKQGNGAVAKANDKVKVKYEGRLIDGTVFDSTDKHGGDPVTFSPSQVIKGWTEALCLMPVGSKWQLYIPQELAYGPRGAGNDIPPYSTLIFDVEVIDIEAAQETKATEEVKPAEEVKQEVKPAKATKKKNTKK